MHIWRQVSKQLLDICQPVPNEINHMCLCFVDVALENNTYEFAGQLLAYSIVHRGTLPTFFSDLLYTAISEGCWRASPELSDVTDESIRQHLQAVSIVHLTVNWVTLTFAKTFKF